MDASSIIKKIRRVMSNNTVQLHTNNADGIEDASRIMFSYAISSTRHTEYIDWYVNVSVDENNKVTIAVEIVRNGMFFDALSDNPELDYPVDDDLHLAEKKASEFTDEFIGNLANKIIDTSVTMTKN